MSDSGPFVAMNCTNCGGKLKAIGAATQVICTYCGTTQVVQRGRSSADTQGAGSGHGAGMQKAAAEMAIKRLAEEIRGIDFELGRIAHVRQELLNKVPVGPPGGGCAAGCLVFILSVVIGGIGMGIVTAAVEHREKHREGGDWGAALFVVLVVAGFVLGMLAMRGKRMKNAAVLEKRGAEVAEIERGYREAEEPLLRARGEKLELMEKNRRIVDG